MAVLFPVLAIIVDVWNFFVRDKAFFLLLLNFLVVVVNLSLVIEKLVQPAATFSLGLDLRVSKEETA